MSLKSFKKADVQSVDSWRSWMVWSCAALFYCYQFILRVSPGVMTDPLMESFSVDACALGVLSGYWYISYSSLQIPIGASMDIWGPRKLLSGASLLCAVGLVLFGSTDNLTVAKIGRLLIGAGSACGYLGCLKLGTQWFSPHRFALVVGYTLVFGKAGAILGQNVLGYLVDYAGWRESMLVLAVIGLGIGLLTWLFTQDSPNKTLPHIHPQLSASRASLSQDLQEACDALKVIVVNKQVWLLALYGALMYVPLSAFADLWGTPYLVERYGLEVSQAAFTVSMVYFGMLIGAPAFAILSERMVSRRWPMIISALGTLVVYVVVCFVKNLSITEMTVWLFIGGFLIGGQPLMFASVCEVMPKAVTATTVGFTNMIVMLSGVFLQPAFGWLLDQHWQGGMKGIIRHYTLEDFEYAFIWLPVIIGGAAIISMFIRETYPAQNFESSEKTLAGLDDSSIVSSSIQKF